MNGIRLVIASALLFAACSKNEHWLRVSNAAQDSTTITVTFGAVEYNKVAPQTKTNYKLLDGDVMSIKLVKTKIKNRDTSVLVADTTVQFSGSGTYYWTCTYASDKSKSSISYSRDE